MGLILRPSELDLARPSAVQFERIRATASPVSIKSSPPMAWAGRSPIDASPDEARPAWFGTPKAAGLERALPLMQQRRTVLLMVCILKDTTRTPINTVKSS